MQHKAHAQQSHLQSQTKSEMQGKKQKRQLAELKEMLNTPTNNLGLAQLFKKFVLIGEAYQLEEVSSEAINKFYVDDNCDECSVRS